MGRSSAAMSVGLPSVCLSVPAVQEQKVCTASVDRQTHHNTLILSSRRGPMAWEERKGRAQEVISDDGGNTWPIFFFFLFLLFRPFKKSS